MLVCLCNMTFACRDGTQHVQRAPYSDHRAIDHPRFDITAIPLYEAEFAVLHERHLRRSGGQRTGEGTLSRLQQRGDLFYFEQLTRRIMYSMCYPNSDSITQTFP